MVLWLSVRCLAPVLEPLYLITGLSSAPAHMYHEFRKIIEFRHKFSRPDLVMCCEI